MRPTSGAAKTLISIQSSVPYFADFNTNLTKITEYLLTLDEGCLR